jgi:hypothetical protein
MNRFDSHGDLLTQHRVLIDFPPTEMAVTSSGRTIVAGHSEDISQDDWKYGGAVLDSDDYVIRRSELPLPPGRRVDFRWSPDGGWGWSCLHNSALEYGLENGGRDGFGNWLHRYQDRPCAHRH